jgi:hypothetical protein
MGMTNKIQWVIALPDTQECQLSIGSEHSPGSR